MKKQILLFSWFMLNFGTTAPVQTTHSRHFSVTTSDGIQAEGIKILRPKAQRVILVCHGLGDSKDNLAPHFAELFPRDTIYAIDFRGHGKSTGKTTVGIKEYQEVIEALRYIHKHHKDAQVFGIGISMGGIALLKAAAQGAHIDAIVTEGSYAALTHIVEQLQKAPPTITAMSKKEILDTYFGGDTATSDVKNYGKNVTIPVLILHSYADTIAPHTDADIIKLNIKRGEVLKVSSVPHACISSYRKDIYQKNVQEFFDSTQKNL